MTQTIGLTRQQSRLLAFIDARVEKDGIAPSYDEMAAHMGLASKSGINRLILALEERGRIRRMPHRARAITVVHDGATKSACDALQQALDGKVAPWAAIAFALSTLRAS